MNWGDLMIDGASPPIIVAEMSGNHNGSLDRALAIVDAVAASGAHAVKIQTYRPDTMTLPLTTGDFFIEDRTSLWHGRSLYELYGEAQTPWEWHAPIFARARMRGLVAFSTPFDHTAVDFLESLDVPAYKIASFENADLPLIRKVAATGKPVIISTGLSTLAEVDDAVGAARGAGCRELALLKCTSSYPASAESSNLATIPVLRSLFNCVVGLSDHSGGIGAAIASVAFGTRIIEKHVTLDRRDGGVDAAFSLEPAELRQLVEGTGAAWHAIGSVRFDPTEEERGSRRFKRSLYVCADLQPGDVLSPDNVRAIRPGYGLSPKYLEVVLGKRVRRAVSLGTPLNWDLIE